VAHDLKSEIPGADARKQEQDHGEARIAENSKRAVDLHHHRRR
jgi:hypothetical protein